MRVLYIGDDHIHSTSFHRASAMTRLGHEVHFFVPHKYFKSNGICSIIHYRTGYRLIQSSMLKALKKHFASFDNFDLIWVNSGEWIGKECLTYLKQKQCPLVLYVNDDPTGGRDGRRFLTLNKALPIYDLCVVVRQPNVSEFKNLGAKEVLRVFMSYDEIAHQRLTDPQEMVNKFESDVCFIGTWMRNENRDEFLLKLANAGIPLSIWGGRWKKSHLWRELKPFYRGGNLYGNDYVSAIMGAKICLGLLSKGNRDQHTTRSLEVPFAEGLLCAERTIEHSSLYTEGTEAIFWGDAEECILKCKQLLLDPDLRENIKKQGKLRVLKNRTGNEDVIKQVLIKLNELR